MTNDQRHFPERVLAAGDKSGGGFGKCGLVEK